MSIEDTDIEVQLQLRDRINYPYLITRQIITFQQAILNFDLSPEEIAESIMGFINMIPESWRDEQFNEDLENAVTESEVDCRPSFAGVRLSVEACIEMGVATTIKSTTEDYYTLFHACINLLDRRGMLSKRRFTERMKGKLKKALAEGETEVAET